MPAPVICQDFVSRTSYHGRYHGLPLRRLYRGNYRGNNQTVYLFNQVAPRLSSHNVNEGGSVEWA